MDASTYREVHQQAVDVFHSLASNVSGKSEHWFADAASIFFTSIMPSDLADCPSFSITLSGQDQDGLSRSIGWQISKCLAIDHEYMSICSSYRNLCAIAPSVSQDNPSNSSKPQCRRLPVPSLVGYLQSLGLPVPSLVGCLQSLAEPVGGYTLRLKTILETPTCISLADIVSADRKFACYPRYFLEKDRARLAATLASSLLCLHDSPWLNSSWSSRDVLFATESGDVKRDSFLRPHAKVAFPPRPDQWEAPAAANLEVSFGILNRPLYSLGMVLLELIMNETLESYKQRDDETEFEVAWRLEREVCGRAGPRWADIVFACLHCPFQTQPDLVNDDFLQVIFVNVVTPLMEMARLYEN